MRHVSGELGVDRDAVQRDLDRLVSDGVFERDGPRVRWRPIVERDVEAGLEEDRIWRQELNPKLSDIAQNVRGILQHGVTEMLNNVFDHSGARRFVVVLRELPDEVEISVEDDGVGIFEKLQAEKGLEDPRHVALELAKGKLTTAPEEHTGQRIFFTARMCDSFLIWSGATVCGHTKRGPWHVEAAEPRPGTTVRMVVLRDTTRTTREVFDEFAPPADGDYGFSRTSVQVDLVRSNGDALVSRSQAKRLLARCDQFERITLDFSGVDHIGPAFADEVFRVFARSHPDLEIRVEGASPEVEAAIRSARNG